MRRRAESLTRARSSPSVNTSRMAGAMMGSRPTLFISAQRRAYSSSRARREDSVMALPDTAAWTTRAEPYRGTGMGTPPRKADDHNRQRNRRGCTQPRASALGPEARVTVSSPDQQQNKHVDYP